jgi:hypothetical protein
MWELQEHINDLCHQNYTVLNIKLVNIVTIMVITFKDGIGALYGTLIPQMLRTSVHRTVVKEF